MTIYYVKAFPVPAQKGIGSIFLLKSLDFVSRLILLLSLGHQGEGEQWLER